VLQIAMREPCGAHITDNGAKVFGNASNRDGVIKVLFHPEIQRISGNP
jgi:hypothetical protein